MSAYIEKVSFPKSCYQPVVDFESWRVAVLKACDDLHPERLKHLQKHLYTDEVFVLLSGSCNLYEAGDQEVPGPLVQVPMEKDKAYNVKKGVWHTHTLSDDASLLIVENQDTNDDNSPVYPLTKELRQQLLQWEKGHTVP